MRLHEHEAKRAFADAGIRVPPGDLVWSAEEAAKAARAVGCPVMVKAQVLAGGRGKAGGIRRAETPEAAAAAAGEILTRRIRGQRSQAALVEAAVDAGKELYVGITVDAEAGRPAIVVSSLGGVDIEEAAREHPEAVVSRHVDPITGLGEADSAALAREAGLTEGEAEAASDTVCRLFDLFTRTDALMAEVNPLVIPSDGGPAIALDAVLEVDDAALYRQPESRQIAEARPAEAGVREARALGMTFVGLDGRIGLICSGAGLGMATMDLIGEQSSPANFLETGGGITRELMAAAMRIVLGQRGLEAVLVNVYGGINPIHEGARGIADVLAEGCDIPVVAKALGNFEEETWATLEAAGVTVVKEIATEKAVEEVLRKCGMR